MISYRVTLELYKQKWKIPDSYDAISKKSPMQICMCTMSIMYSQQPHKDSLKWLFLCMLHEAFFLFFILFYQLHMKRLLGWLQSFDGSS